MRGITSFLAASALALASATPALAQTTTTHDHDMRASRLIGTQVYNDRNEKIGQIDDILLPASGGEPKAVLSVGAYLGGGTKLVQVPLNHVQPQTDRMVMAGADGTKPALTTMPRYTYDLMGGGG
jgi:sporulation protein YlmC with PRC-barrel domain